MLEVRLSKDVSEQLESLRQQNRAELRDLWQQLFGRSPSEELRKDIMVRVLAYKIQEKASGRVRAGTRRQLRQLLDKHIQNSSKTSLKIKPGTRLIREWKGQIHNVIVAERGYEYHGQLYGSLSEIARLITGTRWSGPVFFGIKPSSKHRESGPNGRS
jgi:DUF2924 family protein